MTFNETGVAAAGQPLAAQAVFSIAEDRLTITLRNLAGSSPYQDVPGSTLTGLLWSFGSFDPTLVPVSATVPSGSSIIQASSCDVAACDGATNVGGEFRYQAMVLPGGADRGISSAGYVGGTGNFLGPDLDSPNAVDGVNFGIVSAAPGFEPNGGRGGLANEPLIQDSVVFVLRGVSGVPESSIARVSFQYGTSLTDPRIPPQGVVPLPPAVWLLGAGLIGYLATGRLPRGGDDGGADPAHPGGRIAE